jgi:hypothetical protein
LSARQQASVLATSLLAPSVTLCVNVFQSFVWVAVLIADSSQQMKRPFEFSPDSSPETFETQLHAFSSYQVMISQA